MERIDRYKTKPFKGLKNLDNLEATFEKIEKEVNEEVNKLITWFGIKKIKEFDMEPTLKNMVDYMVEIPCYRQTNYHSTLLKEDFKQFALLKISSSEKIINNELDLNKGHDKNYIFKMIRNNIQYNYDKYLPIRKPYGKRKHANLIIGDIETLNIATEEALSDGSNEIIKQIGLKDYNKLLDYSMGKNIACKEARQIRNKIDLKILRKDLEHG